MPCSAMQCHAMPATMHLEFLGPEIWSRPFWFWHWIKLTLTGRLITLVLRVQKAGLFIWSTKFRYVNSGILLECCRIASNCHCFAVGGARPEAKEMYSAVLISWNSLALWGCDLIYIYEVSSGATETSTATASIWSRQAHPDPTRHKVRPPPLIRRVYQSHSHPLTMIINDNQR